MSFYNYYTIPRDVKKQIERVVSIYSERLNDSLVGIYLHGSVVLNCFIKDKSDIDILIVSDKKLTSIERLELAREMMEVHKQPSPIELSVIFTEHLKPWKHPTPCQFHFSDYWENEYRRMIEDADLTHWILNKDFEDEDIACHIKLIKQSGIALLGRPIDKVFPDVPEYDFWNSISRDIEDFDFRDYGSSYFISNILTLCRIWSYKVEKKILSKYEAGLWAESRLPHQVRYIVVNATASRYFDEKQKKYTIADLELLKDFIISEIGISDKD
ncbi:MAG: aminoglycoside adenylyltransferase domain-containing protein [Clostridium sp.]|uniref:aminoglycoside adenylyltransferase domain-containing protein n=1 Tax=Clostridium sp. TaxID=1506 RepID=UPI003D6CE6C1